MRAERKTFKIEAPQNISLQEAVRFLRDTNFNPEEISIEIALQGPVTASDLQRLLQLPYEVSLTERNDNTILTTGRQQSTGLSEIVREEHKHSRLSLHTHPSEESPSTDLSAPSFADFMVAINANETTPQLIIHPNGITWYEQPQYDPSTQSTPKGDLRDTLAHYEDVKQFSLFSSGPHPYYYTLPREKMAVLAQNFAEETQMIIFEASWDDPNLQLLLDLINLKIPKDQIPAYKAKLKQLKQQSR